MDTASAHPLRGSHENCYYTVGSGETQYMLTISPQDSSPHTQYQSIRKVFHDRHLVDGEAWVCNGSTQDFCRYGIDKPLKENQPEEKRFPKASVSAIPKRLERIFARPQIGQPEDSVDLDTKTKRKRFELDLRKFFVDKKGYERIAFRRDKVVSRANQWVCEPLSRNRLRWDLLMVVVSILNMILIPVMIAFLDYYDWWSQCLFFNIVFDVLFGLDIVYNFRTGFLGRHGMYKRMNLDPVDIQRHYLRGWFAVDLISTLPFDYILPHLIEFFNFVLGARLLNFGKFLGLLRLLRVCRLVRYMNKLQTTSFSTQWASLRTLNMALLMLMTAHWNGCLHFLVNTCLDFPDRGWISLTGIKNAHWTVQYSWCLFNSISQMLCIGYGRLAPETLVDMWFTLWGMLSGSVGFCLIIAHIAAVWQQMDAPKKLHRQKMAELEDYMAYKELPGELRSKIRDYFDKRYNGRMFDEDSIMSSMSEPLRRSIMRDTCSHMIGSLPFCSSAEPEFLDEITTRLKTEIYQPKDIVVLHGTLGEKVYFIQSGQMTVEDQAGNILLTFKDGAYFGELSILFRCERNFTIRAITYCRCLTLSKDDFKEVLLRFPHIEKTVQIVIRDIYLMRGKQESGRFSNSSEKTSSVVKIPPEG